MSAVASRIVTWPDSILEKPCDLVTDFGPELNELRELLIATMEAHNGLGLAAPQIGIRKRAFVVRGFPDLFCNTTVVSPSEERKTELETCLSLPGLQLRVERPVEFKLRWQDVTGHDRARKMRSLDARVALHEHDHTGGILITHRAETT